MSMNAAAKLKLSVHAELAWMDWLDAVADATASNDPLAARRVDLCWDRFVLEFMPPELRILCRKIGGVA